MLAMQTHNAHYTDKREMKEFMPHYEEPEGSINDVMKILSGGK